MLEFEMNIPNRSFARALGAMSDAGIRASLSLHDARCQHYCSHYYILCSHHYCHHCENYSHYHYTLLVNVIINVIVIRMTMLTWILPPLTILFIICIYKALNGSSITDCYCMGGQYPHDYDH